MCDAFLNLLKSNILTVDSKMHDNRSMLFFIETGKLWCILQSSKYIYLYSTHNLDEFIFFVYNNSLVSLNLLYITIDECLLLSCCAWIYLFLQNTVDPD